MEQSKIPLTPVYFNPAKHVPLIKMLARQGMRHKDIAESVGITIRDLGVWRSKYAVVNDAIVDGHKVAQAMVENALFEEALGLGQTVDKITKKGIYPNGEPYTETKTIVKQRTPSVKAQIFILKNIAPDRWRDRQEVETKGDLAVTWNEVRQELPPAIRAKLRESVNEAPEA